MLIDLHSHQPAICSLELLRIESLRPLELETTARLSREEGYYSCGLHPCYEEDMTPSALERLVWAINESNGLCAIGEAGLDKRSSVAMPLQRMMLERQVELSETHHLPLVIHCVQSWGTLIEMHRELSPRQPWIVHGYRKGAELADQLLSRGMWLSFGALYQSEALTLAYEAKHMMLETDASGGRIEEVYHSVALSLGIEETTLSLRLYKDMRHRLLPQIGECLQGCRDWEILLL